MILLLLLLLGTTRPTLPRVDRDANLAKIACPGNRKIPCFLAGDFRVNEQTALTTMHTIWMREHNRIAGQLRKINSHMSSDDIFFTAKNIVNAEIQKITYKNYLPLLLGSRFSRMVPAYRRYDPDVKPNIPNSFATAAFRYGHSQIQPFFERLDRNYKPIAAGPLNLVDSFFDTTHFINNGGTDPILRGLLSRNARQVDEFLNDILTNHLFAPSSSVPGMDLAALNIQRGRDHGLPKYLTWRQWARKTCGVESRFRNELTEVRLLQTYGSLNNVDLFVGGLAEAPLPGGIIGAVFGCIFANAFRALRDGDRFYYENRVGTGGSPPIFTPAQRQQIERTSLSRIVCDNSDITTIQSNAFLTNQRRRPCSSLPSVNLRAWITTSSGPSLPNICFLKFNSGSARRTAQYSSISRRMGSPRSHVSRRTARRMTTGCLSFQCPQGRTRTRITVLSNSRCPVQQNMNLKMSDYRRSNTQYRQFLDTSNIKSQNGIYTTMKSCTAGSTVAFTFCGGRRPDEEEVEILSDSEALQQQQQDIDTDIGEDELRRLFPDIPDILDSGGEKEDKNEELIALMETVLDNLKKESVPDSNAHEEYNTQEFDYEQGEMEENAQDEEALTTKVNSEELEDDNVAHVEYKPKKGFYEDSETMDEEEQADQKDTDINELENALRQLN